MPHFFRWLTWVLGVVVLKSLQIAANGLQIVWRRQRYDEQRIEVFGPKQPIPNLYTKFLHPNYFSSGIMFPKIHNLFVPVSSAKAIPIRPIADKAPSTCEPLRSRRPDDRSEMMERG